MLYILSLQQIEQSWSLVLKRDASCNGRDVAKIKLVSVSVDMQPTLKSFGALSELQNPFDNYLPNELARHG